MVDYLNELREHCLEAYTGIIQGLKGEDDKNINRMFVCLNLLSNVTLNCISLASRDKRRKICQSVSVDEYKILLTLLWGRYFFLVYM